MKASYFILESTTSMRRASMAAVLAVALSLTSLPLSAKANDPSLSQGGYILDNMARQVCQIGADHDPRITNFMTKRFGFEEMEAADGAQRFVHPDGATLHWMPEATEGPTCILTVESGVMDDDAFAEYRNAAVQSLPDYTMGDPAETEAGRVWTFTSNPDYGTDRAWETLLTRTENGAIVIEKRPVTLTQ